MPLTVLVMLTMMLRLRRRIARTDEQYEHRPVAAAEGHAARYPMMQHSGWRPAWQWTVLAGLVVTLGLTLAGQFLPSVDFTFSGLAGAALGDEANSKVRSDPHAPMCVCVWSHTGLQAASDADLPARGHVYPLAADMSTRPSMCGHDRQQQQQRREGRTATETDAASRPAPAVAPGVLAGGGRDDDPAGPRHRP